MPTDTAPGRTTPVSFALRAVAWSLGLFGLVRLGWFETHAILPLTQIQAQFAEHAFGAPALPIQVTLACSGADALALCIGAILAYPARWRMRLAGAAGGVALILALNSVRIGTLGRAAASPAWFEALHVYVWPLLLTLAIAGYVFTWMRRADRPPAGEARSSASTPPAEPSLRRTAPLTTRFVWLTAVFLALFVAAGPWYLDSAAVLAVASFVARGAAWALALVGVHTVATGNVLTTSRGAFLVTQECVSTPLIPVYVAAVFAYPIGWPRRTLAMLAALPLFVGLGMARLLVVALPPSLVASPLFLVHAFYQLLLAGVVVLLAAVWRHGAGRTAWNRALLGATLGGAVAYLLGPPYTRALTWAFAPTPIADPQGAIALLPGFQIGLYIALSVTAFVVLRVRTFAAGLAVLGLAQVAAFGTLHVVARDAGLTPHVRDVRAWALAAPLLVVAAMVTHERSRR